VIYPNYTDEDDKQTYRYLAHDEGEDTINFHFAHRQTLNFSSEAHKVTINRAAEDSHQSATHEQSMEEGPPKPTTQRHVITTVYGKEWDAILNADLPVRPPNAPPVPKPDEILKHPSLDARKKELQISIKDVSLVDIDPGIFNRELVKLKLYAKPNSKHLEQPPVLDGGNITEGTYSGTQAALTHAYSRIGRR
jgi:hypothetical protein